MEARRYRVDARRVVHETIEGEAILINLTSGHYFVLGGCGPEAWSLLAAGHSDDDVVGELERRYPAGRGSVAPSVNALIDELVREELLEPAALDGSGSGPAPIGPDHAASDGSFEPPLLRKFDDLQYFLLVDPIHEVGPAGWPYERRASEAEDAA